MYWKILQEIIHLIIIFSPICWYIHIPCCSKSITMQAISVREGLYCRSGIQIESGTIIMGYTIITYDFISFSINSYLFTIFYSLRLYRIWKTACTESYFPFPSGSATCTGIQFDGNLWGSTIRVCLPTKRCTYMCSTKVVYVLVNKYRTAAE